MNQTLTLLGTLGQTLELRDENPFHVWAHERNGTPRIEALPRATGGRPFGIFDLVPRIRRRCHLPLRTTRCVAYDVESPRHRRLCEARPGELVAVTGHWEHYTTYREETADLCLLPQLVVEDLRVLAPGLLGDPSCGERIVLDLRDWPLP